MAKMVFQFAVMTYSSNSMYALASSVCSALTTPFIFRFRGFSKICSIFIVMLFIEDSMLLRVPYLVPV